MDNPHYITPEEAEEKACPLSMKCETAHCCGGPKCMAWRWRQIGIDHYKTDYKYQPLPVYSTTHGYCGMVRS